MRSARSEISTNQTERIYQAARQILPAIAYGDAAGLPVEAMSAEQISENYDRITELQAPSDHPFFPGSARGTVSDDTQLSLAVARSLLKITVFRLNRWQMSILQLIVRLRAQPRACRAAGAAPR